MAQFFFGGGGGFPGGHGFHHESFGGGGRGGGRPSKPVDNSKFYELLGVEKTATKAQIRKSYLKKAQKEHPDKGGDEEKFKLVQKAYEVLGDEDKRELYDEGGEEAVERGSSGGSPFFGGGGQRQRGPQKGQDSETELGVSLEDLYKGKTTKIALNKNVYKVDPRGMVQDNRGRRLSKTTERKKLAIEIDRGMREGQRIVLSGEGDVIPGTEPGDVVIIVKEKKHARFQRDGCDLVMKKTVSLSEALTGVAFTVTTLDGRTLFVKTTPGQVVQPGAVMEISGEGMPMYRHPDSLGSLFIQFKVAFPDNLKLSSAQVKALQGIMGGARGGEVMQTDDMDVVELAAADEEAAKNRERTRKHFSGENDRDQHRGHHGGNVQQCQTQ